MTYRKTLLSQGVLPITCKITARKKTGLIYPLMAIDTFSIGASVKKLAMLCQ
jgi:hypothetical protein